MKKTLTILFYILVFALVAYYRNDISSFIIEKFIFKKELSVYSTNDYSKKDSFEYVKLTDNFEVRNKDDILNTIYTILDSGMKEFVFYCSNEYEMCQHDVEKISIDGNYLSILNNFVHPYNSYNKLLISTNNIGKVKVEIEKLYSDEEILYINDQLTIINELINVNATSDVEKIKNFHDYIINKTVYDSARASEIKGNSYTSNLLMSHKANGVLKNQIALCSGYTDLMAIFLNDLKVRNYKISTEDHIWNAVYLNGKWQHLDLTWDDPITDSGENVMLDEFFMISNKSLLEKNTGEHDYRIDVYKEIAITN
ncbi:MAG: hypothetical protein RR623_05595 [Bacilli bacterium]